MCIDKTYQKINLRFHNVTTIRMLNELLSNNIRYLRKIMLNNRVKFLDTSSNRTKLICFLLHCSQNNKKSYKNKSIIGKTNLPENIIHIVIKN